MKIKLIALDMDGTTLLDDYKSVSRRNKEAIEAAIKKGWWSSRPQGETTH